MSFFSACDHIRIYLHLVLCTSIHPMDLNKTFSFFLSTLVRCHTYKKKKQPRKKEKSKKVSNIENEFRPAGGIQIYHISLPSFFSFFSPGLLFAFDIFIYFFLFS